MSGSLINIIPKRTFDFSSLVPGLSETLTIAERIDVSQYAMAVLIARIHAASAATGSIQFQLYHDYTGDSPGTKFFTYTGTSVAVTSAVTPPALLFTSTNLPLGHYAALAVVGSLSSAGSLNATVSIDLCLRCADDTDLATVEREYPLFGMVG